MSVEEERNGSGGVAEAVEQYTATTVPVHVEIRSKQAVLNLAEATKLLRKAAAIALGPCECRQGKHEGEAPAETCLALNRNADSAVAERGFRRVTPEEALAALGATHQAGFVHLAYRKPGGDEVLYFCSCCTCCCWFLNVLKRFSYRDAVAESSRVARHDEGLCVGCGLCVTTCPVGAIAFPPRG